MKVHVCPFCSVVSVAPHQSQQACIQALQTEIAQTRQVLEVQDRAADRRRTEA